jgi:hypothetical protein
MKYLMTLFVLVGCSISQRSLKYETIEQTVFDAYYLGCLDQQTIKSGKLASIICEMRLKHFKEDVKKMVH